MLQLIEKQEKGMKELNKVLRKTSLMISIFILTIYLSSCAGGRELDTLGIVISTGFDLEDGKIIITNEVVNPAAAPGGSSSNSTVQEGTVFVQGIGNTISEAITNTTLTFDRILYFPHSHLVIFGEEFARRGIGDYVDILGRNNEQREKAFMLVAQGAKAYDVMGVNSGIAQSPGHYIHEIIREDIFNEETRSLTITEFFKYYYREHEGVIMGALEVVTKPQVNKQVSQASFQVLSVEGGAVFKGDKLVGYFTGDEMIGFNFLVNEIKKVNIEFESPEFLVDKDRVIGRTGKFSVVQIFRNTTKKDIKLIDGKLHLFIDVKFRGGLNENTQGIDISQPGILNEMEEACAKKAKEFIEIALNKAQKELKIDTFSIGELLHRKHPDIWKEIKYDWEEVFEDLEYTINVKAHINDTGFTNTPPNIRKGKY